MAEKVDIGILVGLAWESFVRALHQDLAERGYADAGASYGFVFRAVDDKELSITELAAKLGISSQAVTKLINEMSSNGYVERWEDAADRRVSRVRLTTRGRSALVAARRFHRSVERSLTRSSSAHDVEVFRLLLTSVIEAWPGEPAGRRTIRPF